MSTYVPDARPASPADTTTDPVRGSAAPALRTSFEAHDASATFDVDCTDRLPNLVDRENQYIG